MSADAAVSPWKSFVKRHSTALLIGGLILILLCVAAVWAGSFFIAPPTATIPAAQEQIARHALQNPADAPLHLGRYGDVNLWSGASSTDYAVQDGMVIFPSSLGDFWIPKLPLTTDLTKYVLVYAPDGSDLSTRPPLPTDRTWFYGIEWFLYNCSAITGLPEWWQCTLLVGSNI